MAMLSTYSDLEDQLNSDDLESEVERGSNFTKKTKRNIARSFFYSDRHEVGQSTDRVLLPTKRSKSVCCETSRAWPKLSELELSSRAIKHRRVFKCFISRRGADEYVKHGREAAGVYFKYQ